MNDQIHSGDEHGELGDAEYAEFMELAAEEGFDVDDVENAIGEAGHGPLPVLAVVGRPNVGKSTLVNRIIGRREAVVEDKPGVTRDRVTYEAEWAGRRFKVVDTGGWEQDVLGIDASVAAQAEYAIEAADAVVFVVDSTVGATDTDEAVVKLLRRAGKPVVLCANKVDGPSGEADATALWSLGLGQPHPVSSLHGRGTGDMLDAVLEALPEAPAQTFGNAIGGPRRIALIGRPNVGKSSLLNKVANEDRVVVNEVAGTTRDPVDELIELGGVTWKFVDTAGIRRRVHLQEGADYYASLRTAAAVEKAEVAVVLIDATESISVQDQRIITMAVEAGRAMVVAFNKWDNLDEERRYYLEREIETELGQIAWAPRVNVSARTGRHMEKLVPAIETALGAGRPGSRPAASTRSSARSSPRTRTRSAVASNPASSSVRRPAPSRRGLCSSPPASWSTATAASSSAGCARSSASRAPRSTSRCGCARSAATSDVTTWRCPGPVNGPGQRHRGLAMVSALVTRDALWRSQTSAGCRWQRGRLVHPAVRPDPRIRLPGPRVDRMARMTRRSAAAAVRPRAEGLEVEILLPAPVARKGPERPAVLGVERVVDRRGRGHCRYVARGAHGRDLALVRLAGGVV